MPPRKNQRSQDRTHILPETTEATPLINCAARSCPPLHNRAYTAENLERTLEERTRRFVRNERYNRISPTRAEVSKIFDWYADDFGDLRTFLSRYAGVTIAPTATVVFLEYDWRLNE